MKKPNQRLHEINEHLEKILDLSYPLCKSNDSKLQKICHELNNKSYFFLKEIKKIIDSSK